MSNYKYYEDFLEYPNVSTGHEYALGVVSGSIVANRWVVGACKRYLGDLGRIESDTSCPFYFKPQKAERFLRIVQKMHHAVGTWDNACIIYEPWQCFVWMCAKGFHSHHTNEVRFRTVHLDVARGNAKSTMASQVCLYDLCCDNPQGNRIYCAATSRMQAGEVLEGAQIMAKKNNSFTSNFKIDVMAKEILHRDSNSFIKSISAQANNADGKIGKTIITDELHAMQRKLYETLVSGQSKRRDSQIISITTAGYANDGIGASQRAYAKKVSLGEIEDDTFFALVYQIEEKDSPWDPTVWIKANPNFGVSVDEVNFAAQAKKAQVNPEDKAGFMIKHLNLYLGSALQYFNVKKWKENKTDRTLESFKGKTCYVGVDIASKIDLTSICYLFKEGRDYYAFFDNFVPEARVTVEGNQKYARYIEEGDLVATPGEAINLLTFYKNLVEKLKMFRVKAVHADPWNARELLTKLSADRYEAVEYPMRVSTISEPMKKVGAEILENRLKHNSMEMLEWCLGNVVAKEDHNANVYPRKEHETLKIDPIISLIMAMGGYVQEEADTVSVYEGRGLRII